MAEHAPPAVTPEHGASTVAEHGAPHEAPTAWGMEPGQWIALAMIVVFALMLWKKVPAAIGAALARKIATIRQQLDEASQLRAAAEALRAEYEAKSAQADAEAATMIERAKAEAEGIVRQAESDAAALVERRTRMAEEKIAAAERTALAEVRAKAASAAASAAGSLIAGAHDAAADKPLVDSTIAQLGQR